MSTKSKKRARPLSSQEGREAQTPAGSTTEAARARQRIRLEDGTGELRFWPSLLTHAHQQRLYEELTLRQDSPRVPQNKSGGGRGGGCSGSRSREGVDVSGAGVAWMQRPIKLFGREILQPRLTCFYGQEGITYRYSGKTLEATPWGDVSAIQEILAVTEAAAGVCSNYFNCVLLNWYRDGGDYMGWHSDDEKELERGATIASLSLGAERRFQLRRKKDNSKKVELVLGGGSLLLMEGSTQEHWQHRVPKRTAKEEREIQGSPLARGAKGTSEVSRRRRDGGCEGATGHVGRENPSSSSLSKGATVAAGGGAAAEREKGRAAAAGRVNLTFRRVARRQEAKAELAGSVAR